MRSLDLDPDGIADLVERSLLEGVGGWSMGVQGALAEFVIVAGERVDVRRRGRTVEARTAGGGIRLTISDQTLAYGKGSGTVTLAVPRATLPAPSLRVTVAPADPGALRPEDVPAVLVDLAVGHSAAAFCVRTPDPALVARLRAVEGLTWQDALDEVGHLVVATSPQRVVTAPLGRIEVYNPIPAQWDTSPEGCHTHLLPALLATGREVAEGEELPPQLAAAGNCTKPG
ncbi:MAG: hypothetical protein QOD57_5525 [Actinomycetota bacterium]|nr:hypothetical protein [Actinomycetota bacterium]